MKHTIKFVLTALLLAITFGNAVSQYQHVPVRLTYGNDRNPAFHIRAELYDFSHIPYEFLAYERTAGSSSNIMVSSINTSGPLDSGTFITNNSFANTNPTIGYYIQNNTPIINSLVVWETNRNGNKDIYAKIYKSGQGWLSEFPVDSSAGSQISPKVSLIGSNKYAIVYQSLNDIKLKVLNTDNQTFVLDTNLTAGIGEVCRNPFVVVTKYPPFKMYISFEREFSSSQNSVYCLKSDTIANPLVMAMDTVRFTGINYNNGIFPMNFYPVPYICIYETYVSGKRNTFGTQFKWNGQSNIHHNILTSSVSDMWCYRGSGFISGDNTVDGMYGFLNRVGNSTFLRTMMNYGWDSVNVLVSTDTNYSSKITLSSTQEVPASACMKMWFAYEKQPTSGSNTFGIYAISFTSCALNIRKLNNTASSFSLSQNYPNPFNPVTKIMFSIPSSTLSSPHGVGGDLVQLKIYDITGREIQTLVNESLAPGTYETTFDGSMLNSGIYFYKLITNGYTVTKKMLMIK